MATSLDVISSCSHHHPHHTRVTFLYKRSCDRMIYGGLLALDEVWVSSVHKAIWLETDKPLKLMGSTLPAGKYALFTIPSAGDQTVIINLNWNQHGKDDYQQSIDLFRFTVTPETLQESKEQLVYEVNKVSDTAGTIYLAWEQKKISFPLDEV